MLLVKSAEVLKTRGDTNEIIHQSPEEDFYPKTRPSRWEVAFPKETIRGQYFLNEKGEWVNIGWSTEVQEALSLPFKCFHDQGERIEKLEKENRQLRERLYRLSYLHSQSEERCRNLDSLLGRLQNKSFWQRLKWAFKPY